MFWNSFYLATKISESQFQVLNLRGKVSDQFNFVKVHDYVRGVIFERIMEFEFFRTSVDVKITVINEDGIIVFREIISTVKTLHLIVGMHDWLSGYYVVTMTNTEGIFVSGYFVLAAEN